MGCFTIVLAQVSMVYKSKSSKSKIATTQTLLPRFFLKLTSR